MPSLLVLFPVHTASSGRMPTFNSSDACLIQHALYFYVTAPHCFYCQSPSFLPLQQHCIPLTLTLLLDDLTIRSVVVHNVVALILHVILSLHFCLVVCFFVCLFSCYPILMKHCMNVVSSFTLLEVHYGMLIHYLFANIQFICDFHSSYIYMLLAVVHK